MNVFDLVAKLTLDKDGYEQSLNEAEKKSSALGDGISKAFGVATKATVAAVSAAATAIGALTVKAVESYADYEQLVGGVETLFGAQGMDMYEYAKSVGSSVIEIKDQYNALMAAQTTVMDNAANAYKTAGLSANEYMETVTSFAAALTSSLDGDTQAAAEKADVAITDMADNANKMGTAMESIQNAYQGFAKQNYTMLDNLKLGYGGTKEEMERLLADAEELSGVQYDISSYADIVDAIHVVQTEMGITGTTAEEAEKTISGSLNMVKSAWSNLITGMADENADFDTLISNLVDSAGAFESNVLPRVEQAMKGVGQMIEQLLPPIMQEVPTLIAEELPALLNSGTQMLMAIVDGINQNKDTLMDGIIDVLTQMLNAIVNIAPSILTMGAELIATLAKGIVQALPNLISSAKDIIVGFMDTLEEVLPELASSGIDIIFELITGITEAIPEIFDKAAELITSLAEGIEENLPTIVEEALTIIQNFATTLAQNIPTLLQAGFNLIEGLVTGIFNALPTMIEQLPTIITTFANIINDNMPTILAEGVKLIIMLVQGIIETIPVLVENIPKIIEAIIAVWSAVNWLDLGKNLVEGIGKGMTSMLSFAKNAMQEINDGVINLLKGMPSKLFSLGKTFISEGLIGGLKSMLGDMLSYVGYFMLDVLSKFGSFSLKDIGGNLIKGLWGGIEDMVGWIYDKIAGFGAGLLASLANALDEHSPSKATRKMGVFLAEGLGNGWVDKYEDVKRQITSDLDFSTVPISIPQLGVGASNGTSNSTVYNQTINVNREVSTADDIARACRLEARYGIMRGVAIG